MQASWPGEHIYPCASSSVVFPLDCPETPRFSPHSQLLAALGNRLHHHSLLCVHLDVPLEGYSIVKVFDSLSYLDEHIPQQCLANRHHLFSAQSRRGTNAICRKDQVHRCARSIYNPTPKPQMNRPRCWQEKPMYKKTTQVRGLQHQYGP